MEIGVKAFKDHNSLKDKIEELWPLYYPNLKQDPEEEAKPEPEILVPVKKMVEDKIVPPPKKDKNLINIREFLKKRWIKVPMALQFTAKLFLFAFVVCGLVMVLSTVNLAWFRSSFVSKGEDMLVDYIDRQMIDFAAQASNEFTEKFFSSQHYLSFCADLFRSNLE